jgi:hypothetical protein
MQGFKVMYTLARSRFTTSGILFSISAAALASSGCSSGDSGPPVTALYIVPRSPDALQEERFFDHPWPSDLRIEAGAPRLRGFYNPRGLPIIQSYIDAMDGKLDGFSPAAAGFLRFDGPIDASTLPATPTAALAEDAAVQLVDVDPASPERGKRSRISLQWREDEGVYLRANTLSFMPTVGFPLRPHTRYALVVTDKVRGKQGGELRPSADLMTMVGRTQAPTAALAEARKVIAPAIAALAEAGIDKYRIVHLAVFTTADPVRELFAVRDHLRKSFPAPTVLSGQWRAKKSLAKLTEYIGAYGPSPNYQDGKLPFRKAGDGGQFKIERGEPRVVDTFSPRFSLTVPDAAACPMPAAGYPVVLYAHGTGGDYESYVRDGTATALAERCVAAMGTDQIFHGTRPGAPPDGDESTIQLLFFNFENPVAARTNGRQSAIDEVQRARLFTESRLTVPASVSVTSREVYFDPARVMFFGHSQGGLNGPLYLAADDSARGGVLSGSGALITIGLLEKTKPAPSVSALVKTLFLGLSGDEAEEANEFHPIISLAQSIVDVVDPIHYGRFIAGEPREGFAPKSVYMTEGINPDGTGDSYAPPHGIEAHALAIGLPLQVPFERIISELSWGGAGKTTIPKGGLSGNLARGTASGVLAQWAVPADAGDGHFVVFRVPSARAQAAQFIRNLADDARGRVPSP